MVAKRVVAVPQVSNGSVDHGEEVPPSLKRSARTYNGSVDHGEITPSLKRSARQSLPKQGLLQDIPGGSADFTSDGSIEPLHNTGGPGETKSRLEVGKLVENFATVEPTKQTAQPTWPIWELFSRKW